LGKEKDGREGDVMVSRLLRSAGHYWALIGCGTVVVLAGALFWFCNWYANLPLAGVPDPVDKEEVTQKPIPLPEAERHYLWEVEHHGNILNQKALKSLSQTLRHGDRQQLTQLLANQFQARIPVQIEETKVNDDLVEVWRQSVVGTSLRTVDRAEFVEEMLALRQQISQPPQVQISLMTFPPERRRDLESNWRAMCLLRMWGFWAEGKPAEVMLNLELQVSRPSEQGIASGKWLLACPVMQTQVGKAQRFLFREVAVERGIDASKFHDNWKSRRLIPHYWTAGSGGAPGERRPGTAVRESIPAGPLSRHYVARRREQSPGDRRQAGCPCGRASICS
jgi:hypothetical protein